VFIQTGVVKQKTCLLSTVQFLAVIGGYSRQLFDPSSIKWFLFKQLSGHGMHFAALFKTNKYFPGRKF